MGNVGTHLAAENQLLITSAEAMDQSRSKNSSSGWNAGLAIEFGQGGTSMGVTVGANLGKGHANADSLSHRHSHIGSLGSLTSLSVGGSTTLAGAQVFGEEVHVKTPNLIIQSVQDTATYEGKQQEMGGQITVGYGVSGSANFSRSSINADYASVTEQSGIYAGDGGYQIEVAEHTELIGGLITSTAAAEAEALSGALENRFDAAALQKELDTQREVSQAFSQNVQSAKAELNQAVDRLKTDYEAGRISQAEYEAKRQQLDNGALLLSTIAAGLSAPTDSALGIATATLSPSVAKEIGQYFKSSDREGSTEHLIAHGLLAAAVAATGGNNALSAAGAAVSAEAAAPILADYLYGKEATDLNAEEKATISSITSLVGAGVGGITGTDSGIAQGAQSAGTAVDNNYLGTGVNLFGWQIGQDQYAEFGQEMEAACAISLDIKNQAASLN